jgi:hypothetical protein
MIACCNNTRADNRPAIHKTTGFFEFLEFSAGKWGIRLRNIAQEHTLWHVAEDQKLEDDAAGANLVQMRV